MGMYITCNYLKAKDQSTPPNFLSPAYGSLNEFPSADGYTTHLLPAVWSKQILSQFRKRFVRNVSWLRFNILRCSLAFPVQEFNPVETHKTAYIIWRGLDRASPIICGNKMSTRCNRWIFIADLIACSTCFGHHYAHLQELESIIHVVAACRIWCLVFKLSVWCGARGCVFGLRAAARKTDT